jgi:hypothetical protein
MNLSLDTSFYFACGIRQPHAAMLNYNSNTTFF